MSTFDNLYPRGTTAELIVIDEKPMLILSIPNQPPITLHPTPELIGYFGLEIELSEIIDWLDEKRFLDRVQKLEECFQADARKPLTRARQ